MYNTVMPMTSQAWIGVNDMDVEMRYRIGYRQSNLDSIEYLVRFLSNEPMFFEPFKNFSIKMVFEPYT